MKMISIAVPCYNEQETIPAFYQAIIPVLKQIGLDYEVIFVDDGSKDDTAKIIKDLANNDSHIKYVIFSRNFGKESAMYAGLSSTKGDYVAIMDVDLQDPPEKLIDMYNGIAFEGYDCVGLRRVTREGEPKIRSFFARQFYKTINKMSETEIVDGARDYRLMTRKMVDAILSVEEYNRFSKGIFSWVGFKQMPYEYERQERYAGKTKYPLKKMLKLASDGIISFSTKPLKIVGALGILTLILSVVILIYSLISYIFHLNQLTAGWTSIMVAITLFSGVQLISIWVIAEYIARIYDDTQKRPEYIVDKEINTKRD